MINEDTNVADIIVTLLRILSLFDFFLFKLSLFVKDVVVAFGMFVFLTLYMIHPYVTAIT